MALTNERVGNMRLNPIDEFIEYRPKSISPEQGSIAQ
jgi:hypothetical protein